MKIWGFIPARMSAARFPGKPLQLIAGNPMLAHVYARAMRFIDWHALRVCTPDMEIFEWCRQHRVACDMTSHDHTRAMDRCAEAAMLNKVEPDDIVVVVQGDEPMLTVGMIEAVVAPIVEQHGTATMLCLPIREASLFNNPDILKVVTDTSNRVRYTSRASIPRSYSDRVPPGALRIGGIFGFRMYELDWFCNAEPSPLEIAEHCDSNRICGHGRDQLACVVPYRLYYSVDRPEDIALVEAAWKADGTTV